MDEEQIIREVLSRLQRDFMTLAQPYIDELVRLQQLRVPEVTINTAEQQALYYARQHLADVKPMSGAYMGASLDLFTRDELLKIMRELNSVSRPRTFL